MVDIEKAITVRYKIQNSNFEILVESPEKAFDYRNGKTDLDSVLVTNEIFYDIKKGMKANEHEMQKLFNTNDKRKIMENILKTHPNIK